MSGRAPFGLVSLALGVLLVLGSACWWAEALTFGLVSGLVVLMIPAWLLLMQAGGGALATCLGLWRDAPRGAAVAGVLTVGIPGVGAVVAYAVAYGRCWFGPEREACLAYLNGSPLLPFFVVVVALLTVAEVAMVLSAVRVLRRS